MKNLRFLLIMLIILLTLSASLYACKDSISEEKTEEFGVEFPTLENLQFICAKSKVSKGENITFSVDDAYATRSEFVLSVGGAELSPIDGVYTINNVQSDVTVEFAGAYDDTFTVSYTEQDTGVDISFSQTEVTYGKDVTVSALLAPAVNNSTIVLKANGNIIENSEGVYNVTNITANQEITVEGIQTNTVKLNYSALGNGRITGTTAQSLLYGENASTVTAVAYDTYHFKAWSDGVLTAARTDQSVIADKTVFAIFERDTVRLSWESQGRYSLARVTDEGKTTVDGDYYPVIYGEDFVFEILLSDAYSQSSPEVNVNGESLAGEEGVYKITSVTAATVIQVSNLSVNKYSLNFAAPSGITFEYAEGTNTAITHGTEYSFRVAVDDYYSDSDIAVLINNQVVEGQNGTYTITVDEDKTVSVSGAEINRCKVTFDTAGGLPVAPLFFTAGQYLRDFPEAYRNDSRFIGWSKNGENLLTADLLVDTDITLTALYQTATPAIYNVSNVIITGSESGEVIIADMHNNIKITSFGLESLGTDYSVTTLYMGNNITTLTGYADSGALSDIETIHFSKKLTYIPYMAFMQCTNLTTLELSDSVTEIADYAFFGCSELVSITGKNVSTIGANAFFSCALQNADFDSVERIGNNAFAHCSSLNEMDLSSVNYFGDSSFFGAFADSETIDIVFNNGVIIGDNAFNSSKIDSIEFGGSADIGESAFSNTALSGELRVDDGSLIGDYAFWNCTAITSAVLPVLSEGIFGNSDSGSLVSVTVTKPIFSFPAYAFLNQSNITSFVYPATSDIAEIGDYAFYNAFSNCGFNLTVYGGSLAKIGDYAFQQCKIETLAISAADVALTIGEAAFANTEIKYLTIPSTIEKIGAYAFFQVRNSSFFDNFTLTYGLTDIGQMAFCNIGIDNLVIPSSVTTLGAGAFWSGPETVYFLGATPPAIQEAVEYEVFLHIPVPDKIVSDDSVICVTETSENAYRTAWPIYSSAITSGTSSAYDVCFKYNRYEGDDDNYLINATAFASGGMYLVQQPSNPARDCYYFVGWSLDADTYEAFDFRSTATLTDDLTLYAFWEEISYPVSYNLDGGANNGANPTSFTVNDDIELLAPSKAGYYFDGWYTSGDFTDRIYCITGRSAALELYAKFLPDTYTVYFMVDNYIYNSQLVIFPNTAVAPLAPVLYDYDFEGWYIGDTEYDFSAEVDTDLTIVSKWTAKIYDYTFNANGGSFDGDDTTVVIQGTYLTGITVVDAPVRYGYEFDGWRDNAGVIVNFPSFIGREDFTVYASWNRKVSYVTFDYDGGSGTEGGRRIAYDTEYGYLPTAYKAGYIFDGWYDADADGLITAVSVFSYTVDTIFIAKYTEISYNVSFLANGGDGNMTDLSLNYTEEGTLPSCEYTRTGYTFIGWSKSAAGGAVYSVGTAFDRLSTADGSTVFYYAVWSENSYTVTFDANGGEGETAEIELTYSESGSLPENGFLRDGYTFSGWSVSVAGDAVYREGAAIAMLCEEDGDSVTFFALWEINSYDVTLYISLVSGEAKVYVNEVLTRNYNAVLALADFGADPEIEGYRFNGWYDAATVGSEVVFPYTVTRNAAFYAQMSYLSYTVSFTNADEEVEAGEMPAPQTIERYGMAEVPPEPTANGYTFTGWTLSDGSFFDFGTPIISDVELFASWELTSINYTVTLRQISVFEDTETGLSHSDETLLISKITSGTITDNVTVTVGIAENEILRYSRYRLDGYYTDESFTQAVPFPYEVTKEFSEEDTITGEESVTVNYYIYVRYLKASSALSFLGGRAYLTADADNVIIPDVNNGFVITQFDAGDYAFSALNTTVDVVSYDGLAGFAGTTFNLSYRAEMLDIEGLSSAERIREFTIYNPKAAATRYTVEGGVLYFDGALCCYPRELSTNTEYSNPTLTAIMDYAFMNTQFNGFNLPNVTDIGRYAFSGAHITLFDFGGFAAGAIGAHAFDGTDITAIDFNNFNASVFEDGLLPDCVTQVTYRGSGELTQAGSGPSVSEITITGFTKIAATFGGMPALNKVTVSDSCTVIGQSAFKGLSALHTIIFEGEITEVQNSAFLNTPNLTGEIPSTVTVAGEYAFQNSGLINGKDVDISGYTRIDYHAFKGAKIEEMSTDLWPSELVYIFDTDICATLSKLTIYGGRVDNYSSFSALRDVTINSDGTLLIYGNSFKETGITSLTVNAGGSVFINYGAFYNCDSLAAVNITCDRLSLDTDSFAECGALKVVKLECGVSNISVPFRNSAVEDLTASFQGHTLADYAGAYNSISIVRTAENSDYYINNSAFFRSSIREVVISPNITYLSAYAFANCYELKDLYIPATVNYCERYLLSNTNLTSISLPGCFSYSDMLGIYNITTLRRATIINKEGVSAVSAGMFKNVNSLQEVVFAESITAIGEYAFYGCCKIAALNLDDIDSVGAFALYGLNIDALTVPSSCTLNENALTGVSVTTLNLGYCGKTLYEVFGGNSDTLKYVNMLEGVSALCDGMFKNYTNLLKITLPESLERIGKRTFMNCQGITGIYLSNNVTAIGEYAFYGCTSLSSVSVSMNISDIGIYAFAECVRLETAEIKSSLAAIPVGLFSGCISLSSTNIPYSVTAIGKYAYYNNTKLTKVVIPAAVSKIGEFAFWNNTVLSEINFPDALRSIERYAFYACASFTDVVLPNGITSIGDYAFAMCIKMISINIPDQIETLGTAVLDKATMLSTLSLPSQLKLLSLFSTEEAIPVAVTTVNYTKGNGYLADNALSNLLKIQKAVIGEGIRVIGANAFNNCENLTEIILPSTLVSIKEGAFSDTKITGISLSDDIIDIGEGAFAACEALSEITLPSKILNLGEDIFYGCIALTAVDASDCTQLYTIGDYAFMNCISLKSFALPATVALIGNWAFAGCTALKTFATADDSLLYSVGHYAFKDCVILEAFRLPVSVISLGWGVFYNCSALRTFTVETGRNDYEIEKLSDNLGLFLFFGTSIKEIEDIDIDDINAYEYTMFTEYLAKEGELQNVNP